MASQLTTKEKKKNNMLTNDDTDKRKRKTKEIITGEVFGTTPESLGSSSNAAIRSAIASRPGPPASPSHYPLLPTSK